MSLTDDLVKLMGECSLDPLLFVKAAFPWGEPGSELEKQKGPRQWQEDVLNEIGRRLKSGEALETAVRIAVASGHGIGKSALVSWITLWAISTRENTRGVVTANTANQLSTKTWPEIAKWFRLLICNSWFSMTATAIASADQKTEKTWRVDAVTWSKENTEAFAGLHNEGSRLFLIMDEASNIDDIIWEVAEGAMTDANTEIMWLAFGNPTRTTGRFRECFRKYSQWWWSRNIDSRTVDGTNKRQLAEWAQMYGEDSDWYKVRVRGQFPLTDVSQFIPAEWVETAAKREPFTTVHDPIIIGVDVARMGNDKSVIWVRRGNDARTIPRKTFSKIDLMELADHVAEEIRKHDPDAVMIDETGVGGGVVDRLRQLGHHVVGINFASKAPGLVDGIAAANMRAYIWLRGKEWLRTGGAIPNEQDLKEEACAPGSGYNNKNEILIESKDDMRSRGVASSDSFDALWLTFSTHVGERRGGRGWGRPQKTNDEWDPHA